MPPFRDETENRVVSLAAWQSPPSKDGCFWNGWQQRMRRERNLERDRFFHDLPYEGTEP